MRLAHRDQGDDGRDQRATREEEQASFEAAGRILEPADRDGADQAAEVANRVDPGDGCRRGRTAEERGGKRPERSLHAIEADRRHRHAGKRPEAPREQRGGEHPDCGGKAGEEQIPASLMHAVGYVTADDHADSPDDVGNGRGKAGHEVGHAELPDHLREEDDKTDPGGRDSEIDHRERQHTRVDERLQHRIDASLLNDATLRPQFRHQPLALVRLEPVRLFRPIGQIE